MARKCMLPEHRACDVCEPGGDPLADVLMGRKGNRVCVALAVRCDEEHLERFCYLISAIIAFL